MVNAFYILGGFFVCKCSLKQFQQIKISFTFNRIFFILYSSPHWFCYVFYFTSGNTNEEKKISTNTNHLIRLQERSKPQNLTLRNIGVRGHTFVEKKLNRCANRQLFGSVTNSSGLNETYLIHLMSELFFFLITCAIVCFDSQCDRTHIC